MNRYQIRYGCFGAYFYDISEQVAIDLEDVLSILNSHEYLRIKVLNENLQINKHCSMGPWEGCETCQNNESEV